MLDFTLYPVSAVLSWCHTALSGFLDPAGGAAWYLAVVLLVVVLRALLVWPAVRQFQAARRVQALAPEVEVLRRRYPDRVEFTRRQAALHQENGVSAVRALVPALVQLPVLFGLYHVLTQLTRTSTAVGALTASQVHALVGAQLWGVPLSAGILTGGALVAVPLLLLAGLATHLNARVSMRRQAPTPLAGASLWIFPWVPIASALVLGVPTAVIVYWVTTNVWTLEQTAVLNHFL